MQELIWVNGIVLRSEPSGDYDRRVVLLTREYGRITAFAKGARRQTNHLMAITDLFIYGRFKLFPGRSSYSLLDANVSDFFTELRSDYDAALYGMYFLEVMERHTREENDEHELLMLLYHSLRALLRPELTHRLVRAVFELKTVMLQGEFPRERYSAANTSPGALHTIDHLLMTPPEQLYSFRLTEEVLREVEQIARRELAAYRGNTVYKSEELLASLVMG